MNCVLPSQNVKVLSKGLQSLAKIGDELFVEFKKSMISFVTLNQSKTVCARFNLLDSFFSTYEVDEDIIENSSNDSISCKIHMKVLLPLFKGMNLDKKLDYIKINYEVNSDSILFKMKYKCDDIVMVHKLRLLDTETLKLGVRTDSGSNNMCASSSFYTQLLTMFSTNDDEITLEISKDKLVARNYFVGAPHRPKSVRSHVNLNSSEFLIYKIENETTLNFSLKPFRTAIHFAEGFCLNVGFNFEHGGRPLTIIMKNPTFEVSFIVATLNPYSDGQTTISATSIPAKITQHTENGDITIEDQQALLNEDWGDMEMEIDIVEKPKKNKKTSFKELMNKNKANENVISRKSSISSKNNFKNIMESKRASIKLTEEDEVISNSPESPRSKKAKFVFGRCMDPTFSTTMLGDVLAGNSDSE